MPPVSRSSTRSKDVSPKSSGSADRQRGRALSRARYSVKASTKSFRRPGATNARGATDSLVPMTMSST